MLTLYRLEHPDTGQGPWQHLQQPMHSLGSMLPLPYEDLLLQHEINLRGMRETYDENRFAFSSVEQMEEGLDLLGRNRNYVSVLGNAGLKIRILRVSDAAVGSFQALFREREVIQSEYIPLTPTRIKHLLDAQFKEKHHGKEASDDEAQGTLAF